MRRLAVVLAPPGSAPTAEPGSTAFCKLQKLGWVSAFVRMTELFGGGGERSATA